MTAPLMPSRWIADPPADGPTNMARDEILLELVGAGQSPPTLRFYRWSPATISLGYFQTFEDFESLAPPAGKLAVVRRQTGGGAILHDLELTYSLTLPLGHPLLADGTANVLYDHVHQAFARLLTQFGVSIESGPVGGGGCSHRGPFFCFARHSCFDLLVGGRKLMGSAQRRTRSAVLQHGSLILDSRFAQQPSATVAAHADLDVDTHLPDLARAIIEDAPATPGRFTEDEHRLAEALRAKYAGDAWTRKR